MLFYTGLLFLVIAVSLDGFGVGVTYGIRKIHVPVPGLLIIMFCSGIIVLLSMTIGSLLSSYISPNIAQIIGGIILISLGIFSLLQVVRQKKEMTKRQKKILKKVLLFKVLSTPDKADLDQSGTISMNEAFLLGIALAMDAFGAGLGAAIIGYSPLLTSVLIASMSGLFVYSGIKTGFVLSKMKKLSHMTYIPPLLLIALGIYNMF